ncbi:MAG TPA: DinB family protein [Capsulimonadaceae bacterium]|jgi:hypothetical protein
MTHLPTIPRRYLLRSIAGTPDVIDELLHEIDEDHPVWDRQIEPDRFTLREVIAHLADWEAIWLERISRIHDEEEPVLPDYDEGQFAIDHDYAHSDPSETLEKLRAGRDELVTYIGHLPQESWVRIGHKDGNIWTIEAWIVQICAHDGYHTQQIAEWLTRDREIGYAARD